MRRLSYLVLLSLAFLLLGAGSPPPPVPSRAVYLNGVKMDNTVELKNQTFEGCQVRFDENGDVWITLKDARVLVKPNPNAPAPPPPVAPPPPPVAPPPPAPPPGPAPSHAGPLSKRYWLVSRETQRGVTQYDIDVFVNNTWVKKVRSIDEPTVLEITRHLRGGENTVHIVATKWMGDRRVSSSPTDTLEVILGEGDLAGGTVLVDKPTITYTRSAAETKNFVDDYSLTGR